MINFNIDFLEKIFLEHEIVNHGSTIFELPPYDILELPEELKARELWVELENSPEDIFDNLINFHKTLSSLIDRYYENYCKKDRESCIKYIQFLRNREFKGIYTQLRSRMLIDVKMFDRYIGLWKQDDLDRQLYIGSEFFRIVPDYCNVTATCGKSKDTFFKEFNQEVLKILNSSNSWKQYLISLGINEEVDTEEGTIISTDAIISELLNYLIMYYLFFNRKEISAIPKQFLKNYESNIQKLELTIDLVDVARSLLQKVLLYCETIDENCKIGFVYKYIKDLENSDVLYLVGMFKDIKFLETILRTCIKDYIPTLLPKIASYILFNEINNTSWL